jgi:glycosyltransferase involved in cell wall biosynthesis
MQAMDLVCLGYNPWSAMWKRNQQMVAALSRASWIRNVLFVNPDVWMSSLFGSGLGDRNSRARWRAVIPRMVAPHIKAYTPIHLPFSGRIGGLRRFETVLQQRVLRGAKNPLVLLVNRPIDPRDQLVAELQQRAAVSIFDWSDDFETFASSDADRTATRAACEHYLRTCDVTVAVNEHLAAKARTLSGRVHVIRNGTDVERFRAALFSSEQRPQALRRLQRPLIGYSGYRVRDRLDLELIDHLAVSRPNWTFVFIGPHVGEEPLSGIIERRSNVIVHGPVEYTRLPSYIASFDVCILPNRINAHTTGNDPIKLYDYLAAGKPIVSTRTSGADMLDGMVTIAEPGQPFLDAIEHALSTDCLEARDRRIQLATTHSWKARAGEFSGIIYQLLVDKGFFPGESRSMLAAPAVSIRGSTVAR